MKKVKFLKIKSCLLTMLMLLSLSTIVSSIGENVEVADADIHDVNCKFSCEHIDNPLVPPSSNEVTSQYGITDFNEIPFISDEVEVFDIDKKLRETLQNEYAELTDEEIDYRIQEILQNKVDLTDSDIQKILQNKVDLAVHNYFAYACDDCGILLSLEYQGSTGSHSWTNGGVCGKHG